jgi:hypothetical protein
MTESQMNDNYKELLIGAGSDLNKKIAITNRTHWSNRVTLDINPDHKPDIVWDLEQLPLPFSDNEFDEIHAYEVLEHTGQQGDYKFFFAQFSDFWRILKPNGVIIGSCPSRNSVWAWGDPSHKRIVQPANFVYLDQQNYTNGVGKTGISDFRNIYKADFRKVSATDDDIWCSFVLQAVKPSRIDPNYV